jgi:DNA invertase Pin-like site-specific DNA recombinase
MIKSKYNFTETQVKEFYNLYLGGLSCAQVAKQMGITPSTLGNYFKKYGLPIENRQNKINIDLDTLISKYNSGESLTQIAKECGNTRNALSKMLKNAGIEVVNNQNKPRFNENIFDVIDTEEKAY